MLNTTLLFLRIIVLLLYSSYSLATLEPISPPKNFVVELAGKEGLLYVMETSSIVIVVLAISAPITIPPKSR